MFLGFRATDVAVSGSHSKLIVVFFVFQESLVTSISGSFANAMKTKATRQQFLDQCGNLLTQLQNTLASEKQKLEAEVKKRDAMTTEQQKLVRLPPFVMHSVATGFPTACVATD